MRLTRALLLALAASTPITIAWAYFSTGGTGSVAASATVLAAPTISSATPEAASVSLSWSAVTPPSSGTLSYYVTRDGGAPAGNCPTSTSPSGATSCTDSGVSVGSHTYRAIAVWRSWTATSEPVSAQVTLGPASQLVLAAATTTPTAGAADNLTITAKDSLGNTATSYTGSHNLTFGPVADSPSGAHATVSNASGTATNFGSATAITFSNGVATVSGANNGVMTLVKAGATSITVSDGSINNGSGLAVTVGVGTAARLGWTHATSTGTLSSPCLFTCTGSGLGSTGNFKANVSVTDSSGNTVSNLGSGHTVSVTAASGTITGGALTIAATGAAESTTQFTYTPSKSGGVALTGATSGGNVYTSASATMTR
jgi:hypothetical protein